MAVTGGVSGRDYTEQDIFTELYPRMKEEPLFNRDDELVVPVRNTERPHYRRVGRASFLRRLGRAENNPTHDECVQNLYTKLCETQRRISISSYIFADDGTREEQSLFATGHTSDYRWFREADARVAFDDDTYIQPDLAGRDANRFFPRASCPNIIIEVIRTHAPDFEAFAKLYELSLANSMIVFYFIGDGSLSSKLNHMKEEEGCLTLRVSHYMIGGQPYNNGKPILGLRDGEEVEHWHTFLSNSYFRQAKEKASA
ncbi:hypothetical protein HP062_16510 [Pseudomonas sp. B14-6]|uniref:hypothetical protein n=1 Tax=Pseudomonas sp. B14-6 TaxID=2738843 RepID=UPI00155F2DF1|nr:hypothetical protein [Pseudomonas sp. B14-6]QKG67051.1 hypothetical protein HP062_16510 [Pseudomonas sp. B14-6]